MSKPLVSVIIPTYNRPSLVKRAIRSVLNQSFQDFEIVVVDDGLEKRSGIVVNEFADGRIRYIKHEENKGCSAAKNTGIGQAKGKYVAILDDDDKWLPEKLKVQVAALENAPADVGFSFHGAVEVFEDREHVTNVPDGVGDYLDFALRTFSGMIDSSMMYRHDVFNEVGGLDESFPTHTGAEFVIRVAKKFKGVGINKPLVRREMRGEHEHMGSNINNRIRGREMLLARYRTDFEARPAYLAKHLDRLARFYRDVGNYGKASRTFWRAFLLQPRAGRLVHVVFPFLRRVSK